MTEEQAPAPGLYLDSGEFVPADELGASDDELDMLDDHNPAFEAHVNYLASEAARKHSLMNAAIQTKSQAADVVLTDAQIRQIHFDWLTSTGGADSLIGFARAIIAATAAKKAAE